MIQVHNLPWQTLGPITDFFVDARKEIFFTNDICNYYTIKKSKIFSCIIIENHYDLSSAKTKYKIFKQEVQFLNLFSSCRRLKRLQNSSLVYFAVFLTMFRKLFTS